MFAVANGDDLAAKVLMDANANINVQDFEGHTPLDYATNFGHEEVSTILKNYGAKGDDSDHEESSPVEKDGKKAKPKKKGEGAKKKGAKKKAMRKETMSSTIGGDCQEEGRRSEEKR